MGDPPDRERFETMIQRIIFTKLKTLGPEDWFARVFKAAPAPSVPSAPPAAPRRTFELDSLTW
jgi:hypothetical protein